MRRVALVLALLAAPAAAQLPGLWWHDVYMDAVAGTAMPVAVGNEPGLFFVANSATPFQFTQGTTRRLRVRAVSWSGGYLSSLAFLDGRRESCLKATSHTVAVFFTATGSGWAPSDFLIGQLPGDKCAGKPLTAYRVTCFGGRLCSPPQTGYVVTAVGGW